MAAALLIAGPASAAIILAAAHSLAHGPAEWIQRGGYRNAAGELCCGELCCGERDCAELDADDVEMRPHGYFIRSLDEFVPEDETLPSPRGGYWRCQWGGARKCFFAPAVLGSLREPASTATPESARAGHSPRWLVGARAWLGLT